MGREPDCGKGSRVIEGEAGQMNGSSMRELNRIGGSDSIKEPAMILFLLKTAEEVAGGFFQFG